MNEFELNSEQIETVFKVQPPVTPVKSGHGYQGVLLRDRVEDTVQCHICGKWFKNLSMHVLKHHKYSRAEVYKKEFGLPKNFPLTSRSTSNKVSDAMIGNTNRRGKMKEIAEKNFPKKKDKKTREKISRSLKEYYKTDAHDNMVGLCEKQMEARYIVVMETVGRDPSKEDIEKHDNALLVAMRRRFGSLNKAREHYGFKIYRSKMEEISEEVIISSLRMFKDVHGYPPKAADYLKAGSYPHYSTIKRMYGSWQRALATADLI